MVSERELMEHLRARYFPTEADINPNKKLLGVYSTHNPPARPCPLGHTAFNDVAWGNPHGVDQWSGKCLECQIIEEKEKWLAERETNVLCPSCGGRLRHGECINRSCPAQRNNQPIRNTSYY